MTSRTSALATEPAHPNEYVGARGVTWPVARGGPDNTDIEDGDGGGSNPSGGCGDNGGDSDE